MGTHSCRNSLTACPTELESDYRSSAEGHDDEVKDNSFESRHGDPGHGHSPYVQVGHKR
jgi:hypothetical protein